MDSIEIKNLRKLINPLLGENKEYVSSKIKKLTSAGDNYGSLMVAVDITIKNDQNQTELIHAVAKMLPTNKFVQFLFNSERTFYNEVHFYKTIAPCLRQFQKENGMVKLLESYPKFYGARMSLEPSCTKPDENAVLLIKNVKEEGFTIIDRIVGFDLEQSKLILEKMSELHGTTLAMKLLQPEIFKEKFGHLFQEFKVFDAEEEGICQFIGSIMEPLKDDEICVQHLTKIRKILKDSAPLIVNKNSKNIYNESFSTFVHTDMWVNNIMVKIVDNKTTDVKFVDYQIYEYSSLSRDVVFFLFTSVQLPVIQKHCDDLIAYYYNSLINYLKQMKCDTSPFSLEDFFNDIKEVSRKVEFYHIMLMLGAIFATKENSKDIEEMEQNDFTEQRKKVTNACKEKAYFVVHEFMRRGWIELEYRQPT